MKFISTGNGGARPFACMCSTTTGHADARHTSWIPPCLHCGCSCGSKGEYKTGNRVASLRTIGQT